MNVNWNGLHHRNRRPKEYLCANFDRFWRGSDFRMCCCMNFGDLSEVKFMNLNWNGLHHHNQRPKEYLCANFGQFWRGSAF